MIKWIGQHIWDFVSRFRNDVYLESLTTTTESNVLVVDSDGKVSKSTSVGGDITSVTAGTNCSGGGATGDITINVDDAFLINSGDDTTSGVITAGGFTTTGTWTFDEYSSGTVGITTVQDSGTTFNDNDTSLMTAAAIDDHIQSYSGVSGTDLGFVANGTSLTVTSNNGNNASLPLADTNNWGVMSDEMFDKLDGIEAGAQVNVATNLANGTVNGSGYQITSSTGTNVDISAVTTSAWGMMTDEDKTKLDGIEAGATADQSQADINGLGITTVGTIDSGTWEGTDVAVAHGGTGASSASDARTNLGLVIGTNVLAQQTIGIANDNLVEIDDADAANGDYAKFTANGLEGRSTSEVLSDIGAQAALTFGIANTNAVKIDSGDVADDEYARFTANGLESRSTSEVLSDIGAQAALTFGIGNGNAMKFASDAGAADDDFLRIKGTDIEGLSAAEVKTALSLNNVENTALSTYTGQSGALDNQYITNGAGYVTANTMGSGFTVSATTDSNATTITQGEDLFFAAGTGITCETTADGTVTITNTVSNTDTTYTAGTGLDLGGTEFAVDVSDFMANGSNNRVVTATGTDAMNAEANLTFNGSTLSIEADSNTTASGLFIDCNSLTTGHALEIDVDDAIGTTHTTNLAEINYNKSANAASGQTIYITGLDINMDDDADSNAGDSFVYLIGVSSTIDTVDADPLVSQATCYSAAVLTGPDSAYGLNTSLPDGSAFADIRMRSAASASDYAEIRTGANGALTIETTNSGGGSGTDGHIELAADGDITLDSAGQIKLEPASGNNILLDDILTIDGPVVVPVATSHNAAGTDISIGAGSTTAGTTNNIAGGSLTIHGGQGKGTGAGGDIIFKTANAGASGSSLNSLATALTISDDLSATFAGSIVGTLSTAAQPNITTMTGFLGGTANALITDDGDGTVTSESNLTWDGSDLILESATASKPMITLKATHTHSGRGGELRFVKEADDTGDGEALGFITWYGDDDAGNNQQFIKIKGEIEESGSGTEGGKLTLMVASHNGQETAGLVIEDGNASGEVDVTIGGGTDSLVSVAGGLSVTSDFRADSRILSVTGSTDGEHQGDVVRMGGTTSMDVGQIYHYKSDGTWEKADADTASTSDGLLGIALGSASDTDGVLLRGMVTLDHDPGAVGDVLYVGNTAGRAVSTAPSNNNNVVRIIGYCLDASNGQIWFNPDNTFVEVTA